MLRKIEKNTRNIFHKLHTSHLSQTKSVSRLRNLINEKKLGLKNNYLKGKECLDAGCGSSFHGSLNLLNLGAKKVTALDLNKSIFAHKKKIKKLIPKNSILEIKIGSVLKLPFKDNTFDFILCQGVIHHTIDPKKAVKECFRTLKKGGYAYFQICGKGGIIQECVMNFLRQHYKNDILFKKFLVSLNKKKFNIFINKIKSRINKENSATYKISINFLKNLSYLIDEDLILTIKDRVLSPLYYQYTYDEVIKLMKVCNFTKIKRVYTYPKYKNLRNIVAYFYNKPNDYTSKLLYGSGLINIICKK
jgi:ubiquinone/menaquinone biosynthesis C-methylase UbiE